jgi:hypothetical protein
MKQEIEPRSEIKPSSIWQSPRFKHQKRLWNFASKKDRGQVAELPPKLKKLGFKGDKYQFGQYIGSLADIKEFAAMKGISFVSVGAVKYKTKEVA